MDRVEFLRELKESLIGRVTAEQLDDILYDYAEHFDAGVREGRTENEVSQELGSPAKLSRALLPYSMQTIEKKVADLPYAPLGLRLAAFVVDSVMAGLPVLFISRSLFPLLFLPLVPVTGIQYLAAYRSVAQGVVPGVLSLVFFVLYQPLALALWNGQTLGKRLLNLRVVKKDGQPLTPGVSLLREILGRTIINTVSLGLSSAISFLWALFSQERRTVHDEIGGTRVIVDRK